MTNKQKSTPMKSQKEKFIETARALGCEDNENRYDAVVKKLAEQKPEPRTKKKRAKK